MGKVGRKPLNKDQEQGVCIVCKTNKQMPAAKSKLGFKKFISFCSSCSKKRYGLVHSKRKHTLFKEDVCSKCGFVPQHKCQLDVHHIDYDHNNNDISNLITLCANCHRLEHKDKR